MGFLLQIGLIGLPMGAKVRRRTAVRGVITHGSKMLLVHTGRGDYKFPGGGMEPRETMNETLLREVREETGYDVTSIGSVLGQAYQRRVDAKDSNAYFEMRSIYIRCDVARRPSGQNLDEYEKRLQFRPRWIELSEAVRANEAFMRASHLPEWDWTSRETRVLKWLQKGGKPKEGIERI